MATDELNNHNCFQKLLFVYSTRAFGDYDKQCLVGAGSSEWWGKLILDDIGIGVQRVSPFSSSGCSWRQALNPKP